jgi:glycosyltransferase involved in cell wall biosynthesis
MITALASYPEREKIAYHIYGSGPYEAELLALVKNNDLEKIVTLYKPVSNLFEVFNGFDLFALLSKGEAFPIAPLEAMASGLPLLVSNYEPYPEFVEPDFGFLIQPEAENEIHSIIDNLLNNDKVKKEMSINSRRSALLYSWKNVAKAYAKII